MKKYADQADNSILVINPPVKQVQGNNLTLFAVRPVL